MAGTVMPKKFRGGGEGAIASFNFADIADGAGYVTFVGFSSNNTSTVDYHLSQVISYSHGNETTNGDEDTTFTKNIDIDFDTTAFNLPRVVKGLAFLNIPFGVGAVGTFQMYVIAKIIHVDASSTETQLGTATTNTLSVAGGGSIAYSADTTNLAINLSAKQFKSGEKLRITLEGWTKYTASHSGSTASIGHSPQGIETTILTSTNGCDSTKFTAFIPFEIDL